MSERYKNIVSVASPAVTTELTTLIDILQYRAQFQPNQPAYILLADGEKTAQHLTYAELDNRAKAIANLLQDYQLSGTRVLMLYPQGLDFIIAFFGCLYAGIIAVPLPPPNPIRPQRTLPRIETVAKDAQPEAILTTSAILQAFKTTNIDTPTLMTLHWFATDNNVPTGADDYRQSNIDRNTVAYLQYTSGSTSKPKGVIVSQGNLIDNCEYGRRIWDYSADCLAAHWMPNFHDYGLIDGIIAPLFNGFTAIFISPLDFLKKPIRWLQMITNYQVTHSAGPNFAYDLCIARTTPEQRANLDLSSWRMAANAAESIRKETLIRFTETFAPYGFRSNTFYPSYGLAEATLVVSARRGPLFYQVSSVDYQQHRIVPTDKEPSQTLVGCGRIAHDMRVVIANPHSLTSCAENEVGEIWLSHTSVTQGYWNCPAETEQTFRAYLSDTGEGPFLRTGDLGFLKGDELFVTGRFKDLIIINGRNYYPQDIELTVEKSDLAIRPGCCAVFSIEINNREKLAIVAEIERIDSQTTQSNSQNYQEIIMAIRRAIAANHDLPIYTISLINVGAILKTSSGKIQRQACRRALLDNSFETIEKWQLNITSDNFTQLTDPQNITDKKIVENNKSNPIEFIEFIEKWLAAWVAQKVNIPINNIDINQQFIHYGIDSITAVQMAQDLEQWLAIKISPTISWDYPSIRSIANFLTNGNKTVIVSNNRNRFEKAAIEKLLDQIEELSDQEADRILSGTGQLNNERGF